ncbi:exo-beta-N-acetylmuramidase NamZ domain-containing protein [Candidatus Riflebacteria bacterium]
MPGNSELFPGELVSFLKGKAFNLISNYSARTSDFHWPAAYLLAQGCKPTFIFTPEHGWNLKYQEFEAVPLAEFKGIPLIPLFQKGRRIDDLIAEGNEVFLFDLNVTGTRCFTYVSLLYQVMRFCHKKQRSLLIYEKPNVLPSSLEGPLLEGNCSSYVSLIPTPFQYKMNIAELACFLYKKDKMDFPLIIFPIKKSFAAKLQKQPYFALSPNLAAKKSLCLYPATVFFEGTDFSEGRGTPFPFQVFGLPGFPAESFIRDLPRALKNICNFEIINFVPKRSKWQGKSCTGLRLRPEFDLSHTAFQLGIRLFCYLFKDFRDYFMILGLKNGIAFFDKLMGSTRVRELMEENTPPEEILNSFHKDHIDFSREVEDYVRPQFDRNKQKTFFTINKEK